MADDRPAADDRVAVAVAELYGGEPEAFTERRKALAAEARASGDKKAATAIAALRRPTRAAWIVNRLARADPSAPPKLAELATALRAAQQARHGPRLRELSATRGPLIDALTEQALAVAGLPDPPAALRDEVAATLTAALADPEVAAEFVAGTLTKAAHWSGFGFGAAGPGPVEDDSVEDAEADSAATKAAPSRVERPWLPITGTERGTGPRAADVSAPDRGRSARRGSAGRNAARPRTHAAADAGAAAQARQREEARRLAEEAAERTARRRKIYEDAERTVASTVAAAAETVAAEDRLEAEVRDLEARLTQARSDLAAARTRARRAEAAERRARQALERLSGS